MSFSFSLRNFRKKNTWNFSPKTWRALRGKQPAKVTAKNGGIRESQTQWQWQKKKYIYMVIYIWLYTHIVHTQYTPPIYFFIYIQYKRRWGENLSRLHCQTRLAFASGAQRYFGLVSVRETRRGVDRDVGWPGGWLIFTLMYLRFSISVINYYYYYYYYYYYCVLWLFRILIFSLIGGSYPL